MQANERSFHQSKENVPSPWCAGKSLLLMRLICRPLDISFFENAMKVVFPSDHRCHYGMQTWAKEDQEHLEIGILPFNQSWQRRMIFFKWAFIICWCESLALSCTFAKGRMMYLSSGAAFNAWGPTQWSLRQELQFEKSRKLSNSVYANKPNS